uniref:SHSP domain-containing protein n=1 Tax=Parastrongyloides trichosuri TaxID=131310 RepID=A0A0N4Z1F3_PARTI
MTDRWMTPFLDTAVAYSPFTDARRWFDDIDRALMSSRYWANKSLAEAQRFGEACPEVVDNEKEFKIKMDVSHFAPNELKVNVKDNMLQIEGQHEEKSDKHGTIQRMFVRKYKLPKGVREDNVKSELSKDGVLTVGANKLAIEGAKSIPIEFKQ